MTAKLIFIMEPELKSAIEDEAKAKGVSQAEIMREAVIEKLGKRIIAVKHADGTTETDPNAK